MPVSLDDGRLAVPQNFIECDRDQELLLPPSLREWLAADHLAWFVIDAVAEMDVGSSTPLTATTAGAAPPSIRG
jgi:hypothetical protein